MLGVRRELGAEFDEWLGVPGRTVSQGRYWWYLPRDWRSQVRPDAVKTADNSRDTEEIIERTTLAHAFETDVKRWGRRLAEHLPSVEARSVSENTVRHGLVI